MQKFNFPGTKEASTRVLRIQHIVYTYSLTIKATYDMLKIISHIRQDVRQFFLFLPDKRNFMSDYYAKKCAESDGVVKNGLVGRLIIL